MTKASWTNDWTVGFRMWVERRGEAVLGEGRAELLAAIDQHHSITKGAKAVGMSYRRAWTLVQEVNAAAGEALVKAAPGGVRGGGATLTARGRLAVDLYEQVRQTLVESAAGALQRSVQPITGAADCLHLAAAISLQEAVGQILAEYALLRPATRVRVVYGASNELADHLLAGAPGDIFLSAEPAEISRLEAAHLLVAKSRRMVAQNGLAIVGRPSGTPIKRPAELLASRYKKVAMAEPACPLGQYAQAYLQKIRLYEELLPKVLHVDNSRAVLSAVVSGAADVGVAFSSDTISAGAWTTLFRVPASQAAASYEVVLVSRGKRQVEAHSLLQFLASPAAQRCFRRCGLRPAKI